MPFPQSGAADFLFRREQPTGRQYRRSRAKTHRRGRPRIRPYWPFWAAVLALAGMGSASLAAWYFTPVKLPPGPKPLSIEAPKAAGAYLISTGPPAFGAQGSSFPSPRARKRNKDETTAPAAHLHPASHEVREGSAHHPRPRPDRESSTAPRQKYATPRANLDGDGPGSDVSTRDRNGQ